MADDTPLLYRILVSASLVTLNLNGISITTPAEVAAPLPWGNGEQKICFFMSLNLGCRKRFK